MAAPWATQRRPQGPTTLTPHPKPIISVEDWETKSPLGELQTRSVNALKRVCEERRLPLKVRLPVLDCICRFLYI
jgi:conserved oligomeric Golgi complex subunit 3